MLGTLRPNGLNINFFVTVGLARITYARAKTMVSYFAARLAFRACVHVEFFLWRGKVIPPT